MTFESICKDIKEVRIQGAREVAKAALKALLLKHDAKAIKKLVSLRPTEPALRNSIKLATSYADIREGVRLALANFDYTDKKISDIGKKIVKDGMNIFTHCHSNTVNNILVEAKKTRKKFTVHCTETRPLFQGRKTAMQLSKAGIPVHYYVDSAARLAIKKCDIMLIGADAITTTRIFNKIGSEMFAIIANKYDVPVYVCTDAWKFDPASIYGTDEKIEERLAREVWANAPKGVKIENPAFEKINPELIEGIISELGLLKHSQFVNAVSYTHLTLPTIYSV